MKSIKKYFFTSLTAFIVYGNCGFTQELQVGNICPDVQLNHVLNYSSSAIKLADFKQKLIIIDFWGTGCSGCIKSFSHLDSLQKKFGDSIQIIMVNKETEDSTKIFFSRHKKIKLPALPFVTQDSILASYFPHIFLPHQVWLDNKKTIHAITGGYNATEQHIADFLGSGSITLAMKSDINPAIDDKPVMFYSDSTLISGILYYSYIMPSISMLNLSYLRESTGNSNIANRIIMNDVSTLTLLQVAFGAEKYNFNPRNTVLLKVKNSSNYERPKDYNLYDEWEKNNSYLFELKIPVAKAINLYKFMQQDLQRFFNIEAKIEKRKIECYVLVRTSNQIKLKHDKSDFKVHTIQTDSDVVVISENIPFSDFVWRLKSLFSDALVKEPVIDATGLDGNLTLTFSNKGLFNDMQDKPNIEAYRQLLHQYNLDLIKKDWITDVLVVKENN